MMLLPILSFAFYSTYLHNFIFYSTIVYVWNGLICKMSHATPHDRSCLHIILRQILLSLGPPGASWGLLGPLGPPALVTRENEQAYQNQESELRFSSQISEWSRDSGSVEKLPQPWAWEKPTVVRRSGEAGPGRSGRTLRPSDTVVGAGPSSEHFMCCAICPRKMSSSSVAFLQYQGSQNMWRKKHAYVNMVHYLYTDLKNISSHIHVP